MFYTIIATVIIVLPSDSLPDKYEDTYGNTWEIPEFLKQDIKYFALYVIAIIGGGSIYLQYYFFTVIRKWADKETFIKYHRSLRNSQRASRLSDKNMPGGHTHGKALK